MLWGTIFWTLCQKTPVQRCEVLEFLLPHLADYHITCNWKCCSTTALRNPNNYINEGCFHENKTRKQSKPSKQRESKFPEQTNYKQPQRPKRKAGNKTVFSAQNMECVVNWYVLDGHTQNAVTGKLPEVTNVMQGRDTLLSYLYILQILHSVADFFHLN